jgi:hypothetical protein
MGEARAHYTNMVLDEREAMFWQAQADQAYNLCLLDKHQRAEEQLAVDTATASDVDVAEQEAFVDSYCTAHEICHDSWRYIQYQADLQTTYKEMDEAADEVFGKSSDEEDIANSAMAAPRRHDHEIGTSAGAADSEEE